MEKGRREIYVRREYSEPSDTCLSIWVRRNCKEIQIFLHITEVRMNGSTFRNEQKCINILNCLRFSHLLRLVCSL